MCTLPHFSPDARDYGMLDGVAALQFDPGMTVFGKAHAKADVLEANRDP